MHGIFFTFQFFTWATFCNSHVQQNPQQTSKKWKSAGESPINIWKLDLVSGLFKKLYFSWCSDQRKALHLALFQVCNISPHFQEGILLFTPFPSTRRRAICAFLLSSLSTTAQMVSAGDVLSHQLELLFVCVGGDVYTGSRFLLILGGKAAPYPYLFMYLQHISGLLEAGRTSHPLLLGGSAGRWGDPAVCLLRGYWAVWKEVTLLTLASPLQGSAGTCMIHYGFL